MDKAGIRKAVLAKRNSLDAASRASLSEKIVQNALALKELKSASGVAAFLPLGNEVDTRKLIEKLIFLGKAVSVPVVDARAGTMRFARLQSFEQEMVEGGHGISEPAQKDYARADSIGLFFVPGLAFDAKGARLGWGEGYYDRFFSESGAKGLKVGLAYSFQLGFGLPLERHDALMDIVVTEKGVRRR